MSKEELTGFIGYWLPKLEDELRSVLRYPALEVNSPDVAPLYGMMQYHMGWTDVQFQPERLPSGKRLRPILCLLTCAEVGGDPACALPAAAGLELLHNFSLIHDDIEDGDETRRHRPTLWKMWGVPQGVNAGDGMFALAYTAIQRLPLHGVSAPTTLHVLDLFTRACLELTEGQYLDLDFEQRPQVQVAEYLRMIEGKTAALLGAAVAMGALLGGASAEQTQLLQNFGQSIGLAFQIQDDILGIWGDPEATGKAAGNDILRRKKSLPLLYALNHDQVGPQLQALWNETLTEEQVPQVMHLLEEANAHDFAEQQLLYHHENALSALRQALAERANDSALLALTNSLLYRRA
jgi:geranylgeranyl diphosphate synthase type I